MDVKLLGRSLGGAVLAAIIGWFPFIAGREVPLLDQFDLGIHELGHMLVMFGPELWHFLAGSILQVAVPLGLAAYFWFSQRNWVASGIVMAWAGTSAYDVAVYAADAPYQSLPLIGGGQHDWAYILGPRGFNAIDSAATVAGIIEGVGAIMVVAGILLCLGALLDLFSPVKPRQVVVVRR